MIERGAILEGRYEIERKLGQGGAAQVFRAQDRQLHRKVAVKVLSGDGPVASAARLSREARSLAALKHPHILEVYEAGEFLGLPYLVIEYAERGTLFVNTPKTGLPFSQTRRFAGQLLDALAFSHQARVVHRDVKPENVLLTGDHVKLADFGLAKDRRIEELEISGLTASGLVVGTPEYLAPEVLQGEAATEAADIFAWACLVLFMDAGVPPHTGSILSIFKQRQKGRYPLGSLKGSLRDAVKAALEPDPAQRPSAQDLLDRLDDDLSLSSSSFPVPLKTKEVLVSEEFHPRRRAAGKSLHSTVVRGRLRKTVRAFGWPLLGILGLATGIVMALRSDAFFPSRSSQADAPKLQSPYQKWMERLRPLNAVTLIEPLHEALLPAEEASLLTLGKYDYRQTFGALRRGQVRQGSYPQRLKEKVSTLPLLRIVEEEKDQLVQVLESRAEPLENRISLYKALNPLACVDAYFRAAGENEPYEIERIRSRFLPHRISPLLQRPSPPSLAATRNPEPGRYSLFSWTRKEDRGFPVLFEPGKMHPYELILVAQANNTWGVGSISSEEHQEASGRIYIANPERYRSVGLEIVLGNLLLPDVVELEWNGTAFSYHGAPKDFPRSHWEESEPTWRRLTIRLPKGFLLSGWNRVKVRTRTLPGLPRQTGMWLDHVSINLGA